MPKPVTPSLPDVQTDPKVVPTTDPVIKPEGTPSATPAVTENSEMNFLKQKRVAEVVASQSGQGNVNADGVVAMRVASYSGDDAKITGSLATTPQGTGNSRSNTRFGKKFDGTVKKINDIASEQVIVKTEGSQPLSKSSDVQGYNGVRKNDITKRTKTKGRTPASSKFQRSLDEIRRDEIYFGAGQVVKQTGAQYLDTPVNTLTLGDEEYTEAATGLNPRGNYAVKELRVSITPAGVISNFNFITEDLSIESDDSELVNAAAPHAKQFANLIEIQRRVVESKAGDESKEGWSALGKAIAEPNATLSLMKDFEQETGNHAYMAARTAQQALAYQINRASKDGNDVHLPMIEAMLSPIYGEDGWATIGLESVTELLNSRNALAVQAMLDGAASFMISSFDSTTKYRTKGDVLTMPNSLKTHLFRGVNFLQNLRANKDFVKIVENSQVFSTLDGEYDGIRPVMITDQMTIINPTDWATDFCVEDAIANHSEGDLDSQRAHVYQYDDLRVHHVQSISHPLLRGVYNWFVKNAQGLRRGMGYPEEEVEMVIPVKYSTTTLNAWAFVVLASLGEVEYTRLEAFKDLLDYENNHGELFTDLLSLKGYPVTASPNFTFASIDEPMKVGKMRDDIAVTWVMPELFWEFDEGTASSRVVLPWYFNENSFEADGNTSVFTDFYKKSMSYPNVRSGVVFGGFELLKKFKESELRLNLDMMIYPMVTTSGYSDFSVYKYEISDDGIPAITYAHNTCTLGLYLTTPRELGFRLVAPARYLSSDDGKFLGSVDRFYFNHSYRAKMYMHNVDHGAPETPTMDVFDRTSLNLDRASIYRQEWMYAYAYETTVANRDPGFLLSTKQLINRAAVGADSTLVEGKSVFIPFTSHGTGYNQVAREDDEFQVIGFHKAFWTRIQLLPMIISPWDSSNFDRGIGEDGQKVDPYDFAYILGLAGFNASDYEEHHYQKMDKQIQEDRSFVYDLYLEQATINK